MTTTTTTSNVDAHEDEDGRRWGWSILGARALIGGWRYRIGECSPLEGETITSHDTTAPVIGMDQRQNTPGPLTLILR